MKLGIISFALGITAAFSGALSATGPVLFIIAILAALFSIVLGVNSLVRREDRKAFPIIGIVLSGIAIVLVIYMIAVSVSNVVAQRRLIAG